MDDSVVALVKKFEDFRKPIASICHGQLILAAADVVKGRKCTAYPSLKPALVAAGAHWVEPDTLAYCTSDGNLITGATYYGHPEFIRLFINALGAKISGSGKRILFLCGVSSDYLVSHLSFSNTIVGTSNLTCFKSVSGESIYSDSIPKLFSMFSLISYVTPPNKFCPYLYSYFTI